MQAVYSLLHAFKVQFPSPESTFLPCLRLRIHIVSGEGIWRCNPCNSVMKLGAICFIRYLQDGGISTSFRRSSFIHCFVEPGIFITFHPQWRRYALELLPLKIPEPGNIYLLEMAHNLLCGFCLFGFRSLFGWGGKNRGSMDRGPRRGSMDRGPCFVLPRLNSLKFASSKFLIMHTFSIVKFATQ